MSLLLLFNASYQTVGKSEALAYRILSVAGQGRTFSYAVLSATPVVGGSVRLVAPGSLLEVRSIPVGHYLIGGEYVVPLELLALTDAAECRIGVRDDDQATWLQVSNDGGGTYVAVPAAGSSAMTGPDLGPLTAGQRIAIRLKVALPGDAAVRTRAIKPVLGLGS
jgi:hypothetical protein